MVTGMTAQRLTTYHDSMGIAKQEASSAGEQCPEGHFLHSALRSRGAVIGLDYLNTISAPIPESNNESSTVAT